MAEELRVRERADLYSENAVLLLHAVIIVVKEPIVPHAVRQEEPKSVCRGWRNQQEELKTQLLEEIRLSTWCGRL